MSNIMYSNNGHAFIANGHLICGTSKQAPTSAQFELVTLGGEYGWVIPTDILLNASSNNLKIYVSAYTNKSTDYTWESPYYFADPDNAGNYRRCGYYGDNTRLSAIPGAREGDREMWINNDMLTSFAVSNVSWIEGLSNVGLFNHGASFKPSNFNETPVAYYIYE